MSQMTLARTAARPLRTQRTGAAPQRARLQVVDAAPRVRSHTGFVLLCAALVVGGLMTALLLNTARAESSFELGRLQGQQTTLHDTRVTLEAEVAAQRSPEMLAAEAQRIGLVPSPSTAVIRLSDASLLGVAAHVDSEAGFTVVSPFASGADPEVTRIQQGISDVAQGR